VSPGEATSPTIGVDLGGTNLRVAVVDRGGAILGEQHEPTPKDWDDLVAAMVECVSALRKTHPDVGAVGVGAAGLVDKDGTIHYGPNLPMFIDAPLRKSLADALSVPVVVDNDANAAAWGEVCHGAARGHDDALVITLGTGIGGGIVVNGSIYRGAHGFAGEVGHWQFDPRGPLCACGELGHWEAAASGTALGRLARERAAAGDAPNVLARAGGDLEQVDGHEVGDGARAGDPEALLILDDYAHVVAVGFAGLANILDPEIIVVSGGLVVLGDLLLDRLRAAFATHIEGAAHRPDVPIVAAELEDRAGVVGAAALARDLVP
jgi:glucokinase